MSLNDWRLDLLAVMNRLLFPLALSINEEQLFINGPNFEVFTLSRSILRVRVLWFLQAFDFLADGVLCSFGFVLKVIWGIFECEMVI